MVKRLRCFCIVVGIFMLPAIVSMSPLGYAPIHRISTSGVGDASFQWIQPRQCPENHRCQSTIFLATHKGGNIGHTHDDGETGNGSAGKKTGGGYVPPKGAFNYGIPRGGIIPKPKIRTPDIPPVDNKRADDNDTAPGAAPRNDNAGFGANNRNDEWGADTNKKPPAMLPPPLPNSRTPLPPPFIDNRAHGYNSAASNTVSPARGALPPSLLIQTDADAPKVYLGSLIQQFDGASSSGNGKTPAVAVRNSNNHLVLQPNSAGLGRLIGGGANSITYEDPDDSRKWVVKAVRLTDDSGNVLDDKNRTVMDQIVGRKILGHVKDAKNDSPFRVARQDSDVAIWQASETLASGATVSNLFAVSRDQNIMSVVKDAEGKEVSITNAGERVWHRLDRATQEQIRVEYEKPSSVAKDVNVLAKMQLTEYEAATINMVIRDLNAFGVVWTDNKLANLDIIPDVTSPTGFTVLFFDFDSFRPVLGEDRKKRQEVARSIQQVMDDPAKGVDYFDRNSGVHYSGQYIMSQLDFTAFGGDKQYDFVMTPNANLGRTEYTKLDRMDAKSINAIGAAITKIKIPKVVSHH